MKLKHATHLPVTPAMVLEHIQENLGEAQVFAGRTPQEQEFYITNFVMNKVHDLPGFDQHFAPLEGKSLDEIKEDDKLDDLFHECVHALAVVAIDFAQD